MAGGLNWHGDRAKKQVTDKFVRNLNRAAITVQNEVKRVISVPSNRGQTPSAPGEPPHKDLGRLRASISHKVDEKAKKAYVGSNLPYAKFLELGTRRMAARPFLRPTIARMKEQIAAILKG